MTVCNMSIEAGARAGMIAPDDITFEYLNGRPRAPQGAAWDKAVAEWRKLPSDPGATYDREEKFDGAAIEPMITYGTNPGMGMAIGANVPAAVTASDVKALAYMGLANHPQWNVHTFVTLGSPLASPMLGDLLDPPLVDGRGQWPGAVQRWVNVRAVGDKAAEVSLTERFGDRVEEVLVDNGHRAHAPEPYLNSAATGAALAAALT